MKLSVVIVNYNVRYFLEQCLHSVEKAIGSIAAEVFVVDNSSVDGSIAMVRDKFPRVKTIVNHENLGFSKANNQAIRKASGEYILLLNPDTIVEESTFRKCLDFMDKHPDAGALGVRMINGKGHFLPESKRALPTPPVAFFKIFGFSKIFPRSGLFNRYHLGYLDEHSVHEVEILTGAFMLLRKSVLELTGLLDEEFFMYGEDIDLSYRIIKAGFKNYYFPETTIIHYKGESTKKSSINYVLVFYRAMIIFARKHFSKKNARYFSGLINMAIYFRAGLSILKRFLGSIFLPLADVILIMAGYFLLTPWWEAIRFPEGGHYPPGFLLIAVPAYITIWLLSIWLFGGYDKPVRWIRVSNGILAGSALILLGYALLPEEIRFSRALILAGTAWAWLGTLAMRILLHFLPFTSFRLASDRRKKILVAGEVAEAQRVFSLVTQSRVSAELAGLVSPHPDSGEEYLGKLEQLEEIIRIHRADEVIFCARDIEAGRIIQTMSRYTGMGVDFKIAPPESFSVIGSHSIHSAGDLYLIHFNTITLKRNRRSKRLLDILFSVMLLLFSPLIFFTYRHPAGFMRNIIQVLCGKKSWVGYHPVTPPGTLILPAIRPGVLSPLTSASTGRESRELIMQANLLYAKDYNVANDIKIIFRGIKQLDR